MRQFVAILAAIIIVYTSYTGSVILQPTGRLIKVVPSPDDVVIEELVDEVMHLTKIKVKITVKLAQDEELIVNWTGVKVRNNEFYIEAEMYKLKGVRSASVEVHVEEREFDLGKLEGGTYKVHIIINGKLIKTGLLVVPGESGDSRVFSPKPEYATIFLVLVVLIAVLILVKYFTAR